MDEPTFLLAMEKIGATPVNKDRYVWRIGPDDDNFAQAHIEVGHISDRTRLGLYNTLHEAAQREGWLRKLQ